MKKKYILAFIVFFFCLGCQSRSGSDRINPEDAHFGTSDASELFFINVRQIYYNREDQTTTQLRIYRLKSWSLSDTLASFRLAIVNNWRYDEAYILIELNALLAPSEVLEIVWQSPTRKQEGKYLFPLPKVNKEAHYKLASQLYQSIR
ncbi:MAG: hypothetical protein HC880_18835, partial [Bacteroidia bacterium]|nr:hypothetical protein [Bacteroidia bacterium]